MLTAEHARVRRVKGELRLVPMSPAAREEALTIATSLLDAARGSLGASRGEVEAAWDEVPPGPSGKRLHDGLVKVIADACTFDAPDGEESAALRRDVFLRATAARAAGELDRSAVLGVVGATRGLTADEVDARLYADLPDAHPLTRVGYDGAEAVVRAYEAGQASAVLLRATRVVVDVSFSSPAELRALLRALKFHRLLFRAEPLDGGGYRLTIDGPMSLFQSTKRYGLALALMLPHIAACDRWSLVADVSWGPAQESLVFRASGAGGEGASAPPLPSEVDALRRAIARAELGWRAELARKVLPTARGGVIVPDLCLSRDDGVKVYLEVLGYFRRETVFERVDAALGLRELVLFAASDRLRVSEELLGGDAPAALYVYKQAMSARAVLERAEALVARARSVDRAPHGR